MSNKYCNGKLFSASAPVAAYVDSNIPGAMDFTVTSEDDNISVTNSTDGLCAVRVTKMSNGNVQYQSNLTSGKLGNRKTAFTFNIETSANYMIEAWHYDSSNKKLVPTVVKYV